MTKNTSWLVFNNLVTDLNECSSNPCQNSGICVDNINSYTCTCMDCFTGINCENGNDNVFTCYVSWCFNTFLILGDCPIIQSAHYMNTLYIKFQS
jgi:hypothetical protein